MKTVQFRMGAICWGKLSPGLEKKDISRELCGVHEREHKRGKVDFKKSGCCYQSVALGIFREIQINTGISFNSVQLLEHLLPVEDTGIIRIIQWCLNWRWKVEAQTRTVTLLPALDLRVRNTFLSAPLTNRFHQSRAC